MVDQTLHQWPQISPKAGNALAEYVMPAIIILVVSMGVLTTLGISLDQQFQQLKVSMQPKLTNVQKQEQLHQLQKGAFLAATSTIKQASGAGNSTGTPNLAGNTTVTQTVGSNGSEKVLANSSRLIDYGHKWQDTNPTLSNLIIQLGQQGQVLGQSFASQDKRSILGQWVTFTALWSRLYSSPDYKVLNASDQAYVLSLTKDSVQLTASYTQVGYTDMGGVGLPDVTAQPTDTPPPPAPADAANQVTGNSNQTVYCGQHEACK